MARVMMILMVWISACASHVRVDTIPAQTRNDVLVHYAEGDSLDAIVDRFQLADREQALEIVHAALMSVMRRYYHQE
jgi:hypothetical protein